MSCPDIQRRNQVQENTPIQHKGKIQLTLIYRHCKNKKSTECRVINVYIVHDGIFLKCIPESCL